MTNARCWNCKHWEGDREAVSLKLADMARRGIDADEYLDPRRNVYQKTGACREGYYELLLGAGDDVPAGFSCILHEPTETDDANT